jgi:hypothetical protein
MINSKSPLLLIFLVTAAVLINGCKTMQPPDVIKKYQKKPFEQTYSSKVFELKGQIITPQIRAAYKAVQLMGDTVNADSWNSMNKEDTSSLLEFRLRLDPVESLKDKQYSQNADVQYGFGQSDKQRKETINEFNYLLQNNIWILVDGKKVHPVLCHTEQNFGMDNGRNIWVGFRLTDEQKSFLKTQNQSVLFFHIQRPLNFFAQLAWDRAVLKKCI